MSVNKHLLVGFLGAEPELRYTAAGKPVCNFNLATNEYYVDKSGDRKVHTDWHRIVVWGKLAEVCNENLTKGSQVYLEGRSQTRKWEDRDNKTHYVTEVILKDILFIGRDKKDKQAAAEKLKENVEREEDLTDFMEDTDYPF